MTVQLKNPLRYPGGKSALAPVIGAIAEKCGFAGLPLYEPYAGSAAISISMVSNQLAPHAFISEKDPLLYAFWKCVFGNPTKLIARIRRAEVSLKTWHKLQPLLLLREVNESELDLYAFTALFFNRTNFSGVIHTGPIGGQTQGSDYAIDCRFNKPELIERIELLSRLGDRFTVEQRDAVAQIRKLGSRKRVLFYVDPPYFLQGRKLYRHYYSLGGHSDLARGLRDAKFPWILSYDKHDVIENLYEGFHNVHREFRYTSRIPKRENELLISNFALEKSAVAESVGKREVRKVRTPDTFKVSNTKRRTKGARVEI